jgi:2-keto-3-deoxy-L-rhamnonate aldolase RhmA
MALIPESESESGDISHELDMVPVFSSSNHDGEMEAMNVHAILEANGIESMLIGPSTIPSLEFQVQVSQADLEAAQRVIAEAQAAGPAAAAEAEAASEETI